MRCELVAALPALHLINRPAAIKLRAAFAKSKQRRVAGHEANVTGFPIDGYTLNGGILDVFYRDAERIEGHSGSQFSAFHNGRVGLANRDNRHAPVGPHERSIHRNWNKPAIAQRQHSQSQRVHADGSDLQFGLLPRNFQ